MPLDLGVTNSLLSYLSNYSVRDCGDSHGQNTDLALEDLLFWCRAFIEFVLCVHRSNHWTSITTLLIPHNYPGCRYHNYLHFTSKNTEQHGGVPQGAGAGRWRRCDLS